MNERREREKNKNIHENHIPNSIYTIINHTLCQYFLKQRAPATIDWAIQFDTWCWRQTAEIVFLILIERNNLKTNTRQKRWLTGFERNSGNKKHVPTTTILATCSSNYVTHSRRCSIFFSFLAYFFLLLLLFLCDKFIVDCRLRNAHNH